MRRFSIQTMMIVIVGIAVMLAMAAEFVKMAASARVSACYRDLCRLNLHGITLGLLSIHDQEKSFPRGTLPGVEFDPWLRLSWYANLLPHVEQQELHDAVRNAEPWFSERNHFVALTDIDSLRCPHSPGSATGEIPATYIGIAGVGIDAPKLPVNDPRAGVFGFDRRTALAVIKDGAAYTMMIAETNRYAGSWLQGGYATVRGLDPLDQPYIGPSQQFGNSHSTGVCVALADGSVRWVSESVAPKIFEAVSTIAGGEKYQRVGWINGRKLSPRRGRSTGGVINRVGMNIAAMFRGAEPPRSSARQARDGRVSGPRRFQYSDRPVRSPWPGKRPSTRGCTRPRVEPRPRSPRRFY